MRNIDLSSWQSLIITMVVLGMFMLISIGIRLLMMFTIQQRRERMNRQINERLKTLIAAYKTLGGSFTGTLTVDPTHLRDLRKSAESDPDAQAELTAEVASGSDRRRRIRDAVEAALSDIILLGTEEQVRLAERAVRELVAKRPVPTHELVVSLRDFIRKALDLAPIPGDIEIPVQGPARPSTSGGRDRGERSSRGGGGMGGGGAGGGMVAGSAVGGSDLSSADPRP